MYKSGPCKNLKAELSFPVDRKAEIQCKKLTRLNLKAFIILINHRMI
jgi:hypothetical protein